MHKKTVERLANMPERLVERVLYSKSVPFWQQVRMEWESAIKDYRDIYTKDKTLLASRLRMYCDYMMPVGYILGKVTFLDGQLAVRPPVLIPRSETEIWIRELLRQRVKPSWRVLDVGCGSGAISLAASRVAACVVAIDTCPISVQLARKNAPRAIVLQKSIFDEVRSLGDFDLIVSNPPYIPLGCKQMVGPSVRRWESPAALFAGERGTLFHERIIALGAPAIAMEMDGTRRQFDWVVSLASNHNYKASILADAFRAVYLEKRSMQ